MNIKKIAFGLILIYLLSFSSFAYAFEFKTGDLKDLVPPSSWAQQQLDLARQEGLITKNTDGFFTMNITREQFAELVVNMTEKVTEKKIIPSTENTFTDTNNENILKAYNAGIVAGINQNTFAPKELITREQIATMLYRCILYIEKQKGKTYLKNNENIEQYTDSKNISDWAKKAVGILANNEIMKGTSATTLSPSQNTTIEQSIVLVYRVDIILK